MASDDSRIHPCYQLVARWPILQGSSTAAAATFVDLFAQSTAEKKNRRLAVALVVSLLLHAPLLLPYGSGRFGSLGEPSESVLRVALVEPEAGQPEATAAPEDLAVEATVVASVSKAEEVPTSVDAPEPVDGNERSEVPVASLEAPASDRGSPGDPADSSAPAEGPRPETEFASAESEAPADDSAEIGPEPTIGPAAAETIATLAPAQEAVLTRRLVREARELLNKGGLERTLAFEDDNRKFSAVLTRQPAVDETGVERVKVDVTSEHGGKRVQTSIQMKRLAFSHFTEFIDRWDPWVQLHDDVITGRLHSNSEILLGYDRKVAPRLLGKVTTARGITFSEEKGWRPRREIFVGGLETGTARIRLPKVSLPVAAERADGNTDVHVVSAGSLIVFHADGAYDCIDLGSRAEARGRLVANRPTYIIGLGDTVLEVRGVVNGNVTVFSPDRIVVQGNLTYARDPRADADSDDYLGLMSDGNVEIEGAREIGLGNLLVQAAIYARQRFVTRNAHSRNAGTLTIYGSLTSGSISETEPRFAMHIAFDRRFERVRPPGFPETDRYELEAWDGRWRVSEAAAPQ